MKVTILIEKVEFGGIQSIGFGLAELLDSNGDDVHIVHGENRIGQFSQNIKKKHLGKFILSFFNIPFISFRFIIRFIKYLYLNKPDVIHSMGFPMGILASILTFKRIPCVVTSQTRIRRGNNFLNQILINFFVTKVILTSDYHKSVFPLKINNDKIVFIPNMIDVVKFTNIEESKNAIRSRLNIPNEIKVLLIVCRLTSGKRVDLFLQIVKGLLEDNNKVLGIIVGDGNEMRTLVKLSKNLNIDSFVRFVGSIDDIKDYLFMSDILVHTTELEIQPMILLEAGAFGLPVVCSNIGGNKTIIENGVNGLIVQNNDLDDFLANIKKLLDNKEIYCKLSKKCMEIVNSKHDVNIVFKDYYDLYNSLIIQ